MNVCRIVGMFSQSMLMSIVRGSVGIMECMRIGGVERGMRGMGLVARE